MLGIRKTRQTLSETDLWSLRRGRGTARTEERRPRLLRDVGNPPTHLHLHMNHPQNSVRGHRTRVPVYTAQPWEEEGWGVGGEMRTVP